MGSENGAEDEKPVRSVKVAKFEMTKYEITKEQFGQFLLETITTIDGSTDNGNSDVDSTKPATEVSWHDAAAYAEWLSQKTGFNYRLPTEAEWEYAAKAGTDTDYFFGDSIEKTANCAGCKTAWDNIGTAPVGSFPANALGLYDMHGNVWEWVQDCWIDNYSEHSDTQVAVETENCEQRVLRGGAWYNEAEYARSSYRSHEQPGYKDSGVGFRLVRDQN